MSELRKAAQQALEALEQFRDISDFTPASAVHAITALRAALAAPEHEPISLNDGRLTMYPGGSIGVGTPSGIEAAHGITGDNK